MSNAAVNPDYLLEDKLEQMEDDLIVAVARIRQIVWMAKESEDHKDTRSILWLIAPLVSSANRLHESLCREDPDFSFVSYPRMEMIERKLEETAGDEDKSRYMLYRAAEAAWNGACNPIPMVNALHGFLTTDKRGRISEEDHRAIDIVLEHLRFLSSTGAEEYSEDYLWRLKNGDQQGC